MSKDKLEKQEPTYPEQPTTSLPEAKRRMDKTFKNFLEAAHEWRKSKENDRETK